MGCNKYKKRNYSRIYVEGYGDSNDMNMDQMAKAGNKAVAGLIFKDVAVGKKKRCR